MYIVSDNKPVNSFKKSPQYVKSKVLCCMYIVKDKLYPFKSLLKKALKYVQNEVKQTLIYVFLPFMNECSALKYSRNTVVEPGVR